MFYLNQEASSKPVMTGLASNQICIECRDLEARVLSSIFQQNASNVSRNLKIEDPMARSVEVTCVSPVKVNGSPMSPLILNCEYYISTSEREVFCIKCSLGYIGSVFRKGDVTYINGCDLMISCSSDHVFYGLVPTIDNLASCYKCSESSKIPFIGLKMDNTPGVYSIQGIQPFGLLDFSYSL